MHMIFKCVFPGSNSQDAEAICDAINSNEHNELDAYGSAMTFKPGSIIMTFRIETKEQLQTLTEI